MRLIDGDALGNRLYHEVFEKDSEDQRWDSGCWMRYRLFEKVLREQPTVEQPEQQWIPCSERLPENGRQVLVYARSVHYALAKYDEMREADGTYKKQWVTFDAWKPYYTIKEVIAWMPLPKPYGGNRNEE